MNMSPTCAGCGTRMTARRCGAFRFAECRDCRGVYVDRGTFARIIARQATHSRSGADRSYSPRGDPRLESETHPAIYWG